jgi:predicted nucleic acid-binding protein
MVHPNFVSGSLKAAVLAGAVALSCVAVAAERGITIAGTAALIGLAKKRRLIKSAKDRFERLHASDFRISVAVIQAVLREVKEL